MDEGLYVFFCRLTLCKDNGGAKWKLHALDVSENTRSQEAGEGRNEKKEERNSSLSLDKHRL